MGLNPRPGVNFSCLSRCCFRSATNCEDHTQSFQSALEEREKSRVRGAIGFACDSHWLKNWRESFKPITKRSNRNHVITFDSHLQTALMNAFHVSKSYI